MATHVLDGNSCSIGIRNCKQPFQCPINSIMQMRLNIRMNIPATLRNYHTTAPHVITIIITSLSNCTAAQLHTIVDLKLNPQEGVLIQPQ